MRTPATRPCESCPYRTDVPPGVWAADEYRKLPGYDAPTPFQPVGVFLCHLYGLGDQQRVCAGWAGCHDGEHLLSLRIAERDQKLTPEQVDQIIEYQSPVPLFGSGAAAARHGCSGVTAESIAVGDKIERTRRR